MLTRLVAVVACLLAVVVVAEVRFTATLTQTNIPGVTGILSGTIYYYYNTASGATNHFKRLDWGAPVNTIELIDYANRIRYKKCSTCFSEAYTNTAEQLFYKSTDQATGNSLAGSASCLEYSRLDGVIDYLYYIPSTGVMCRIKKHDGTIMDFTNYQVNVADQTKFTAYTSWACPTASCSRVMDIVLVVDESGSISTSASGSTPSEWSQLISFCKSIAGSYEMGGLKATIGAVFFGTKARTISALTGSCNDLTSRLNTASLRTNTCLGCGLRQAQTVFNTQVAGRTNLNPSRVVILMSDGAPNVYTYNYLTEAATLKNNYNALIMAIGIGVSTSGMNVLKKIVTPITGIDTAIYSSSFSSLTSVLNKLIAQTCEALPAQDCSGCSGYCSCGKTCICPGCQASDVCTTWSCDATTKACKSTFKSCDDGNACTIDATCSKSVLPDGCARTPVVCNDGNACTKDLCSSASGCYTNTITCPGDKCNIPGCSTVKGCYNTSVTCNDGNPCTRDFCDPLKGCYSEPISCDDGDACTDDTCVNGLCPHPAVSCDDSKPCTKDTCDKKTGCKHETITCDDSDHCTTDVCVPSTVSTNDYTCTNDDVPGCKDYCTGKLNCSDSAHAKPCLVGKCVTAPNGISAMCTYENKTQATCNSGNKCIIDTCDPLTNTCSHFAINCSSTPCKDTVCNPATGQCVATPHVCADPDPCNPVKCNDKTDRCESSAACPHQPCFDQTCEAVGGKAVCTYTPRNCSSGSACVLDTCNNATDSCEHNEISCNDYSECTKDSCDAATGCVYTPIVCDDGLKCTNDTCDVNKGCQYTQRCVDSLWCTDDNCDVLTGACTFTPKDCGADLAAEEVQCYEGYCNEKNKTCLKRFTETAILDVCGGCIDVNSVNSTYYTNITLATTSCVSSWSKAELAVALTGAAIAGIVIAAVIAGIIVLAASSFGTYELVKRAAEARSTQTTSNPLYEASNREATNVAYQGN